jgi:hypothetical protein
MLYKSFTVVINSVARVFVHVIANIRLGWTSLKETNILAYFDTALITAGRSFLAQSLVHVSGPYVRLV